MIGNITKIRLRSYICASSDVFLPSISSLSFSFYYHMIVISCMTSMFITKFSTEIIFTNTSNKSLPRDSIRSNQNKIADKQYNVNYSLYGPLEVTHLTLVLDYNLINS